MIARDVRARSGITLTEILISILIMGVGLISLATLFPLGLLRLREATRNSRGGLTCETAANDTNVRNLFDRQSFTQTWYWTSINKLVVPRDPFVQDASPSGGIGDGTAANGVIASGNSLVPNNNVGLFSGLPFCYDPLWRSITGVMPVTPAASFSDPTLDYNASYFNTSDEARFGAALLGSNLTPYGILPTDYDNLGPPSAHGLQRLSNFIPWSNKQGSLNNQYPFTCLNASLTSANQPADVTGLTFTSNDDVVFNAFTGNANSPSPLLPDMSLNTPQADYRFTWFITGRQVDAGGNGAQFSGEIVVCDGRPFAWNTVPGHSFSAPLGESVVEAVYGYGAVPGNGTGIAAGSDKTVLLRWPTSVSDPLVRVGGWICDVTYERNPSTFATRANYALQATPAAPSTFARCYWYQIGKRTDPQVDVLQGNTGYRTMVLTITSPVRIKTLLKGGTPVNANVALVMPSVINVFPRAFEITPYSVP